MSAPVDVLAVMDHAIGQANGVAMDHSTSEVLARHAAEMREARAAVAELIEATKAIRATRGGTMALGAQDARTVRLWAALARVGAA